MLWLAAKFYRDAKQTACGLVFNTHFRHHGQTEREFAATLSKLVLYTYKDAPKYFLESRCREQFISGLLCRKLRLHLSLISRSDARVHKLVSVPETYRASRDKIDPMSDEEG